MSPTRRQFLLGAAGGTAAVGLGVVGLVEVGALPGRTKLHTLGGGCGTEPPVPTDEPGPVVRGSFASVARGTDVRWAISYPPGSHEGAALPVCLLLPGRGGDHSTGFDQLHADRVLAASVAAGTPPFALAAADGGTDSFWHRRADGDDPERMVTAELLPLLAERGLRTTRIGLLGWSMGGFGALLLAEHLGAPQVAAVAAASPALWRNWSDVVPGAFDDPEDFAAHDVFAGRDHLSGIAVRIDCGDLDPFDPAAHAFVSDLPSPATTSFVPGCHDNAYWMRTLPAQLSFVGEHLSA